MSPACPLLASLLRSTGGPGVSRVLALVRFFWESSARSGSGERLQTSPDLHPHPAFHLFGRYTRPLTALQLGLHLNGTFQAHGIEMASRILTLLPWASLITAEWSLRSHTFILWAISAASASGLGPLAGLHKQLSSKQSRFMNCSRSKHITSCQPLHTPEEPGKEAKTNSSVESLL